MKITRFSLGKKKKYRGISVHLGLENILLGVQNYQTGNRKEKNKMECEDIVISLINDGDDFEIYVNGWYLCNVKKADISLEAGKVLGLKSKGATECGE